MRYAIVVDVVPPAETHQQSARDVLHRPEVGGQEEHHENEAGDEGVAEPTAEHIDQDGGAPEEQVEESDVRVPVEYTRWVGLG